MPAAIILLDDAQRLVATSPLSRQALGSCDHGAQIGWLCDGGNRRCREQEHRVRRLHFINLAYQFRSFRPGWHKSVITRSYGRPRRHLEGSRPVARGIDFEARFGENNRDNFTNNNFVVNEEDFHTQPDLLHDPRKPRPSIPQLLFHHRSRSTEG